MAHDPAADEALIQRLPLPLAQLYRRAVNARTPLDRHGASFYLWEAAIKMLAAVAVAEFAARPAHEPRLAERLRDLARPTLGHWLEFARLLVPVLAEADPGFGAVRDLLLGRSRQDLPQAALLNSLLSEAMDGRAVASRSVRLGELFDRLVSYRNQELGHGAAGQRDDAFYERMSHGLLTGGEEVLGRLDVLAGRRLLYIAEVRAEADGWRVECDELAGETARRVEDIIVPREAADRLPRAGQVYVATPQRSPLCPVHPLMVYDPERSEALFLGAGRGQERAQHLSYTSGRVLDLHYRGLVQLMSRLGLPLEGAQVADGPARPAGAEPPSAPPAPARRRSMGEFELLSELGRGGLAVVYLAWQPSLGRQVALKCSRPGGDARIEASFVREFQLLGRLDHANIVKVYASGKEGGDWFLAMELIEGARLGDVWSQLRERAAGPSAVDGTVWRDAWTAACDARRQARRPLSTTIEPPPPALVRTSGVTAASAGRQGHLRHMVELIRQAAEAAHVLHEMGMVHRNIKPGKILITADGSRAVLMDSGVAQFTGEAENESVSPGHFVGTPAYASPEQALAHGRVDRRSDVYSLGVTLWEMLTLRRMREAGSVMNIFRSAASTEPTPVRQFNPVIPHYLEAVVMKCLAKDPAGRYATARELADDLDRWLRGDAASARPAERLLRWARMHPYFVALGLGCAVMLTACIALIVFQSRPAQDLESDLRTEQRYSQELEAQLQAAGIPPTARPNGRPAQDWAYPLGWVCCGLFALLSVAEAGVIVWLRSRRRTAARTPEPAPASPPPAPAPPRRLRFEPGEAFSSQTVVLHYPAPIAIAYRRFSWSNDPKDQLFRLFLTFQATLRYLVTLGLSDLFHCKVQAAGPVEPLPKNQAFDLLRRPTRMTLGQWVQTLRETARLLARQPGRFVRELPEVCQPGGFLEQDFFRWITDSRNDEFHPDAEIPRSPDECRKLLKEARPRLERLLQEVQFVRSYPLGFVTAGYSGEDDPAVGHYRAHSGMGARAAFGEGMFVLETATSLPVGRPFIVAPDGDRLLYLWPLLLQRESDKTQRSSLYVFETIAEKSEFLGTVEFAAIDHRDSWTETLHPNADSQDWLWEALRRLPATAPIDPVLNLVERLAQPLVGTLAGEMLGPYRLSRPIAKGGFGTVYDALDTRDNSRVAVKALEVPDGLRSQDQEKLFKRFQQEFAALRSAAEGCRHVIRCFERNVTPKGNRYFPWYSMEFAAGGDLTARLLARRAGLGERSAWDDPALRVEAAAEFRAVASAVAHLHDLGFVHRDIKPGNVLIVEEGGGSIVKLSDFGLIKELEQSHGFTTSGALIGTRGYMAPEQERGGVVGAPADVYALGMLLAELATGRPPALDLLAAAGSRIERDPRVDRLPEPLRKLIVRCTDINPIRRPEKGRYVLSDFEAFAASP